MKRWMLSALACAVCGCLMAQPALAAAKEFVPALTVELTQAEAESVTSLNLSGSAGKLIVRQGDKYLIEAGAKVAPYLHHEVKNGTFRVWAKLPSFRWFTTTREEDYRIIVTLPRGREAYDAITLDFASGGGEAAELQAAQMTVDVGSGSVRLSGLTAQSLRFDGGSGSATLENVEASVRFDADLGSGSVRLAGVTAPEAGIDTGSGSAGLSGLNVGKLRLDAHSGRVELEGAVGDIDADTGSGGVSIRLDGKRSDYDLDVSTGSGRVTVDGDRVRDGLNENAGRTHRMELDTGSGSVSVEFPGK